MKSSAILVGWWYTENSSIFRLDLLQYCMLERMKLVLYYCKKKYNVKNTMEKNIQLCKYVLDYVFFLK